MKATLVALLLASTPLFATTYTYSVPGDLSYSSDTPLTDAAILSGTMYSQLHLDYCHDPNDTLGHCLGLPLFSLRTSDNFGQELTISWSAIDYDPHTPDQEPPIQFQAGPFFYFNVDFAHTGSYCETAPYGCAGNQQPDFFVTVSNSDPTPAPEPGTIALVLLPLCAIGMKKIARELQKSLAIQINP